MESDTSMYNRLGFEVAAEIGSVVVLHYSVENYIVRKLSVID